MVIVAATVNFGLLFPEVMYSNTLGALLVEVVVELCAASKGNKEFPNEAPQPPPPPTLNLYGFHWVLDGRKNILCSLYLNTTCESNISNKTSGREEMSSREKSKRDTSSSRISLTRYSPSS